MAIHSRVRRIPDDGAATEIYISSFPILVGRQGIEARLHRDINNNTVDVLRLIGTRRDADLTKRVPGLKVVARFQSGAPNDRLKGLDRTRSISTVKATRGSRERSPGFCTLISGPGGKRQVAKERLA
jgi:hypothetical protein